MTTASVHENNDHTSNIPFQTRLTTCWKKRIVLHSSNDALNVITDLKSQVLNLTAQLQLVNGHVLALQNEQTQQASQLKSRVQALEDNLVKLQSARKPSGSTYVRWGKQTCPGINGTETVYTGFAGGTHYSVSGRAANFLCLSPDPVWAHYTDAADSRGAVYGMEYEFWNQRNNLRSYLGNNLHNEDVPCSVCRTTRQSVLMIPGRNICYRGWTLEYKGYVVSSDNHYSTSSEYICLDDRPDVILGGHTNDDGVLLEFVEAKCGSLKCPPYVNNRELTCAICSK